MITQTGPIATGPLPDQLEATELGEEKRSIWRVGTTGRVPNVAPTLGEQFKATWIDNYAVAAAQVISDNYANKAVFDGLADDDYDPAPFLTPAEGRQSPALLTARSPQELEFIRDRIRQERDARAALAEGPWNPIVVQLLGAFADPVSYIPVAGQFTKGLQGAKLATRLAAVGGTTAVDVAIGEAFAQQSQYERTASESAMAVLLGGTIGIGLGGLGVAAKAGIQSTAREWAQVADVLAAKDMPIPEGGNIGAAIADRNFLARAVDSQPVAEGFARGLSRVVGAVQMAPPALQLAVSKVPAVRGLIHRIADTGVMTKGELYGLSNAPGGSLDMAIRQRIEQSWSVNTFINRAYAISRTKSGYTGKKRDFRRDVHDVLAGGQAVSPEVELVAKQIDDSILIPYENELRTAREEAGLEQDRAWGATDSRSERWSRAQRYNPRKIAQDPNGFRQSLKAALKENADRNNAEVNKKLKELEKELMDSEGVTIEQKIAEEKAKRDAKAAAQEAKIKDFDAQQTLPGVKPKGQRPKPMSIRRTTWERKVDKIEKDRVGEELLDDMAQELGAEMERLQPSGATSLLRSEKLSAKTGVEAARVYLNPKLMRNYLTDDAEELVIGFVRQVAPQVEALQKFGALKIEDTPAYQQALAQLSEAKARAKTPKDAAKVDKQGKKELALLKASWDRVMGVQRPTMTADTLRATQAILRSTSFMGKLGGVMLSSLPDIGRLVMQEGFLRTMRHVGGDVFGLMGGFKMTRKTATMAGTAQNFASQSVMARRWDLGDEYAATGRVERAVNAGSGYFSTATGLPVWTDYWQTFHIQIAQTRVLETAQKLAAAGGDMNALSRFEQVKLAQDGLTANELLAIAKESGAWSKQSGGIQPNLDRWSNANARSAFLRSMHREGETGVYNPGVLDKPLWTSDPAIGGLGKTVSQFKSYSMAATTRILLATAQNAGAGFHGRVAASLAFLTMTGMLSFKLKSLASGKDTSEMSPAEWAIEGIDRSGLPGILMELEEIWSALGLPPPTKAVTGDPFPGYKTDVWDYAAGPALSQISEASDIIYNATRYGVDEKTAQDAFKLTPFNNHFIVQGAFRIANEAMEQ